jgi:hypothetical protein
MVRTSQRDQPRSLPAGSAKVSCQRAGMPPLASYPAPRRQARAASRYVGSMGNDACIALGNAAFSQPAIVLAGTSISLGFLIASSRLDCRPNRCRIS